MKIEKLEKSYKKSKQDRQVGNMAQINGREKEENSGYGIYAKKHEKK